MIESVETTEVQALQKEIESLKEQLSATQRMSALGELVSTTTHEFNNVLMSIINYAKMGLRHKDEATRDKALQKILSSGERAAQITNSVLGMARNRSSRMESTNLRPLIDETLILLERELHKYRIELVRNYNEIPNVYCNGNQIQQVVLNMIINARQAMGEGGQLTIRLSHDAENQAVELFIRDTGPGIPQDQLPKIFEPFFSTKSGPDESGKGGTGLGLAACKNIVDEHRGRIRVQSSVGKGTAFSIILPAV